MSSVPTLTPAISANITVEFVDDRELAKRTPYSRVSWQQFRRDGKGPRYYQPSGRRVLYNWAEVVAWIESAATGGAK